jgi:hypothetical protein
MVERVNAKPERARKTWIEPVVAEMLAATLKT